MLFSIGKDSAVMLHLARKAFHPARPPFPLLHVDTTWKFRAMYAMREQMAQQAGMPLLVHQNPEALARGINPFDHGSQVHTDLWKTQGLMQALSQHGFDAAIGGARRDEEKSRAKERVFSLRNAEQRWDPRSQRPELWQLYNARKRPGESLRVFPLSNWTELDVWQYIQQENIDVVPLYLAAPRPVVERQGALIMVDDERLPLLPGEQPVQRQVRFRTLGCYPLTGAVESSADTLAKVIDELQVGPHQRAPGPRHRPRRRCLDGERRSRRATSDGRAASQSPPSRPDLLRFITCGSVDDGKSTLIGRLLFDCQALPEDQLAALTLDSQRWGTQGGELDFALLMDGLSAEREQGITIDVAYRYFGTAAAPFHRRRHAGPRAVHAQHGHRCVHRGRGRDPGGRHQGPADADAPPQLPGQPAGRAQAGAGGEQGGHGGLRRSHRGADRHRVPRLCRAAGRCTRSRRFRFPACAVTTWCSAVRNMPWYRGPSLLEYLETCESGDAARQQQPLRLPVQWVNRPDADFRGLCGMLASGQLRPGDRVRVQPSGRESVVARIVGFDGDRPMAVAGESVTVTLQDPLDVARGDVICQCIGARAGGRPV